MPRTELPPLNQKIEQTPVPFHLSSRAVAREVAKAPENILISELEKTKYEKVLELLDHQEMPGAIADGMFTVGMIKPHAHQGLGLPHNDDEATDILMGDIRDRGIDVVFAVNIQLTHEEVENHYAEHRGKPFFEKLVDFTSSAPMTYFLIRDIEGNAMQKWRDEIGDKYFNPEERVPGHPERRTLRATYRNPNVDTNNIFHGSDSIESAAREIASLRHAVSGVLERINGDKPGFPSKDDLVVGGILIPGVDHLISVERASFPESSSPAHIVRYENRKGRHKRNYTGQAA